LAATWEVQPASATISTMVNGQSWDPGGGAPDVYLILRCPADGGVPTQTATVADSFMPTWTTGGCRTTAAELLTTGFAIEGWDEELGFDDVVFPRSTIQLREVDLRTGFQTFGNGTTLQTMRVNLTPQP
jgi:hypothetical protein